MNLPRFHSNAEINGSWANAESYCKAPNGFSQGEFRSANSYCIPGQLVAWVIFSVKMAMSSCAFFIHVLVVLGLCSKPKVSRINTRRVVSTGAVVQYKKPFWYWAYVQNPRRSLGRNRSGFVKPFVYFPMAKIRFSGSPNPTRLGFSNLGPKSFGKTWGKTLLCQVLRGNLDHSSLSCAVGLLAHRAFSLSHA